MRGRWSRLAIDRSSALLGIAASSGDRLCITDRYPAIPGPEQKRRQLPDRLRILVALSHAVRIIPGAPACKCDNVAWEILVDEYLVRQVAFETLHIRPHLAREAKAFRLRARLQPRVPNNRNGIPCRH